MLLFVKKNKKGFSLIELMIIVFIIGILGSIAIPLYSGYRKKAITVEAKTNLIALYKFEIHYFSDNDKFTSDLNALGFQTESNKYYNYSVVNDGKSFTATAAGNIDNDSSQDVWTIDDKQALVHQTED